jgi:hypothetical protein
MSNIIPFRAGSVPAAFANVANLPNMNAAAKAGLTPSFCVIGYKGRNWRLKYGGEEEMLKEASGAPTPTLDVVIIGISSAISKIYYDKKFAEGDDQAPDCWSTDGMKPDISAAKKQNDLCATCPKGAWGSRITDAGKKAKACQDSRRLVVVPADDVDNEGYGGPMLLRLPPMSLSNLAAYTRELEKHGAQPFMVRTVLGFNYDVAYPEITFQTTGWLDDATANEIATALNDPRVDTILAESSITGDEGKIQTDAPSTTGAALAGGRPAPATQTQAEAQAPQEDVNERARANAARLSAEAAKAAGPKPMTAREKAAAALAAAEAEEAAGVAAAGGAATTTEVATTAPPAGKKAPFGGKKAAASLDAAAPKEQQVNGEAVTMKPAPEDMEAAIDALL